MKKKVLSIFLSLCISVTGLATGGMTSYATVENNDVGIGANANTFDKTIAFGSDSSGNPRIWHLLGYNGSTGVLSQTGNMVLFAKGSFGKSIFDDRTVNYTKIGSTPQSVLKTSIDQSVSITAKENDMIQPVTLTGNSTRREGTMYGNSETVNFWPLSRGESNIVHLDMRKFSNSDDTWLRTVGSSINNIQFIEGEDGVTMIAGGKIDSIGEVRPAVKIKIGNLLFGSTVKGGKTTNFSGIDNFTSIANTDIGKALKLRFEDNTVLNSTNAKIVKSTIIPSVIKYSAPKDSVMVVEATVGGQIYEARKNINAVTTNQELDLRTLTGFPTGTLVNAKVWIEKMEDTTNNKGLIFAITPIDVTYKVETYEITITPSEEKTFTSKTIGYTEQESHEVTVKNTGTGATGNLTVNLSGANASSFELDKNSISSLASNGEAKVTVKPKTGLAVGSYQATVTVSGSNGITQSFKVNFTVLDSYGVSIIPSEEKTFTSKTIGYTEQESHEVTVKNTGTGATGNLTVSLSGANASSFELDKNAIS
ncbi:MAG: CARDB domain-containing protein, partial [Filifactoraceae bacterium]